MKLEALENELISTCSYVNVWARLLIEGRGIHQADSPLVQDVFTFAWDKDEMRMSLHLNTH